MKKLVRFGVSLDRHLLVDFDRLIEQRKYTNRSEAIRDLIRDSLVGQEWNENKDTVATITLVYDHHVPDLSRKLTHIQHDFQGHITAGMHVHLDHDHCLEVLVAKGKGGAIRKVADALLSLPVVYSVTVGPRAYWMVQGLACLASIGLGLLMMVRIGLGSGWA